MAKLFIVGFPKDMAEIALMEMFSLCGTVNTVTIITDQQSGMSKGYGFVTMTDEAGAQRAIAAINGTDIGSRKLSVRFADDKTSPGPDQERRAVEGDFNFRSEPGPSQPQRKKRPRR